MRNIKLRATFSGENFLKHWATSRLLVPAPFSSNKVFFLKEGYKNWYESIQVNILKLFLNLIQKQKKIEITNYID